MANKVFLVSMSFGLGFGATTMHTDNPAGLIASIIATGAKLEHVSISDPQQEQGQPTNVEQNYIEQQSWTFIEWS